MSIFNIFSKRAKKAREEAPDVYRYDELPEQLRVQITMIWDDALGDGFTQARSFSPDQDYGSSSSYQAIIDVLRREYGKYELIAGYHDTARDELRAWFLAEQDVDRCLDAVEISFQVVDGYIRENYSGFGHALKLEPDDAIKELNGRMREAGIGFQWESGVVVRVDSELIHSEVVKPVLVLLGQPGFEGANEEFLRAHEEFRKGDNRQSIHECGKAFESTLKAICTQRKWAFNANKDTASKLIGIVLDNGLIPNYHQSQLAALRGQLESGTPALRNKEGGHGQGEQSAPAPDYLAAYQLHQTAAVILFLVEAHRARP